MNRPKTEISQSESLPNTIEIRLNDEGHTAASVITERMEESVDFVAYKITHPTDNFVTIRVQSKENPVLQFKKCVKSIIRDISEVIEQVENAC
ncbi:hypothetical protein ECANGB1_2197 [Enterospora canceri]|uniref:DNA-directed RNA polymerase RBP11-like dimerisation domain-containing protein n=1 Tax=Enterospora canceri TaxID=1081671 RepID=A0A1Y1S4Y6_9MICR|nr:hypothetical protein ECANGB1_2197 [Enterospora canceri]